MSSRKPFRQLELKYLTPYIPSLLRGKFSALGIMTVADVLKINVRSFSKLKGLGGKGLLELIDLKNNLRKNPKPYQELYEHLSSLEKRGRRPTLRQRRRAAREIHIQIIDVDEKLSLPQVLPLLISAYYSAQAGTKQHRDRDERILRSTIGIDGEKLTLVELGEHYGVTREFIRQIRNREVNNLRRLTLGETVVEHGIRCSEHLRARFEAFGEKIGHLAVLSRTRAIALSDGPHDSNHRTGNDEAYLDLLFLCFGFTPMVDRQEAYFFKRPFQNRLHFRTIVDEIRKVMKTRFNPVTAGELLGILEVGGALNGVDVEAIEGILTESTEYEELSEEGRRVYQFRFHRLSTILERAVRILREQGRPMRLREIAREIERRLGSAGTRRCTEITILSRVLSTSGYAVPLNHTGVWGLAHWNLPRTSTREIIVRVLESAGEPLPIKQIFETLRQEYPHVRLRTIRASIQSSEVFVRIDVLKIGLGSWRSGAE